MRDVAFYFEKKNGFPKLSDSGLADVFLGGEGLSVKVHLASADRDCSSVFCVKDGHVTVDSLNFSVRDSKHDLLYKTLCPLATGLVKKQITKAITDTITIAFKYINEQLVQVRDHMAKAKGNDSPPQKDVLKDVSTLFIGLWLVIEFTPLDVRPQAERGAGQEVGRRVYRRQAWISLQGRGQCPHLRRRSRGWVDQQVSQTRG